MTQRLSTEQLATLLKRWEEAEADRTTGDERELRNQVTTQSFLILNAATDALESIAVSLAVMSNRT
jgi:hypothetical protein